MTLFGFALKRGLFSIAALAALLSGRTPAAAATPLEHRAVTAAPAALRPWSVAWRRNYLAHHPFVNHIGARGIAPVLGVGKYLYVADYNLSVIFIYDATATTNPLPVGFIADGVSAPAGIAFDAQHNLYVANEGTSSITVYAPGSTTVAKTIPTPFPLALAFGPDGTLYVTGANGTTNQVEVFAPKAKAPVVFNVPLNLEPDAAAVSPANVLTLGLNDQNPNGHIYTFTGGSTTGTQVTTTLGAVDGITYDTAGNPWATDFNENDLLEYALPNWNVVKTVTSGLARPLQLAIDADGIYVPNSGSASVATFLGGSGTPTFFTNDLTFPTSVGMYAVTSVVENEVYMSDEGYSEIHRFTVNNLKKPVEKSLITQGVDFPQGVWIDSKGTLWAANYGARFVTFFANGATKPSGFLTQGLNHPFSVAVDHHGTVYVSDVGNNNVAVFPPGATAPSRVLTTCTTKVSFVTVDAGDTLYLGCQSTGSGQKNDVITFARGATTGTALHLQDAPYMLGLAVDAAGNLYVADYLNSAVDIYAPKAKTKTRVITSGINLPAGIAVGPSGRLYVANLSGGVNTIYASGGSTPIGSLPGYGYGITTSPNP